jgi:hypothetical protein
MSLMSDQPATNTPVIDQLQRALADLKWKRDRNLKLDDAYEWLESAAVDVVDLYKPEGN